MQIPVPTDLPAVPPPPAQPETPQIAPSADPDFKPVSIQHLGGVKTCDCCYYNSSTEGCS